MQPTPGENPARSLLVTTFALAACAFLWPALMTFDPGDWPSPNQFPNNEPAANACGVAGAWFAYGFRYWLGAGAYPLLIFATGGTLARLLRRGRDRLVVGMGHRWERLLGQGLVVACTSAAAHLISPPATAALPVGHGGVIGYALGAFLRQNLEATGTLIVLSAAVFVGLSFGTEGWVLKLPAGLRGLVRGLGRVVTLFRRGTLAADAHAVRDDEAVGADERAALLGSSTSGSDGRGSGQTGRKRRHILGGSAEESEEVDEADRDDESASEEDGEDTASGVGDEGAGGAVGVARAKARGSDRVKSGKTPKTPIVNFPTRPAPAATRPYPRHIENWRLPSLDLLHEPRYGFDAKQEQIVRKQAQVLEQTLQDFRVDARVVEIDTGPVITMFELKLGAGIKVSQIATLSNDIARALKSHGIRVVAPISGKNTVGIEVPNVQKEKVRLAGLLAATGHKAGRMGLPLFLGKDAGGGAIVSDLTLMPHLLIAGTTGSGKSVCLNSVILSLLMTKRPDQVKLILIDPKMVELSQFKDVPHLMCPIVHDMVRAEKILEWAVAKMDERYEQLAEARVKNIAAYNELGAAAIFKRLGAAGKEEQARIATRLPYIVILIDELADLMMTAAKKVEHHLSRLAQKSRAVGIHIIVATQRPEAKVVTGLIKSNLPSRICFRVASRMDSRIVLDQNGGEVLLGQGDMLILPPGAHKLVRAQGTFLEEAEIQAVLRDLTSRAKPEFHPELVGRSASAGAEGAAVRDPMFDEAVRVVVQSRRGSASLLQRRLTIGYSRASRLIEQMADAGLVGDYKGSQAREVLVSMEQWRAIQAQMEADRQADYEADRDEPPEEPEPAEPVDLVADTQCR